jgi:hypothetical protein
MYGINKKSRKIAKAKLASQKRFLDNNFVSVDNESVPLSKFVKNAYNNSDRYIAEVNHRVYSLSNYAKERGLVNIFLTLTLPTEYHKMVGNIRYNPKFANKHLHKAKYQKKDLFEDNLIQEDTTDKIKYEDFTPKAGARKLSEMFHKLQQLRIYRDIPVENKCYFRVYEPHKDGTPHLHASFFVPADKVDDIKDKFSAYIKKTFKVQFDISLNINNPVAYLMKYILKTFDDLREDKNNITDLSLWYLLHGITRFYTSRTLISLDVYRVLHGRYTLLELTQMYKDKELTVLLEPTTKKVVSIYDDVGNIYNKLLNNAPLTRGTTFTMKYKKKAFDKFNGKSTVKVPSLMRDYELVKHYIDLDNSNIFNFTDIEIGHYILTKNEMVNRGLLCGDVESLNYMEFGF